MSDKVYEMPEDYEKEAAFLLQRMKDRDALVDRLRFAKPERIPAIREAIAKVNEVIERTENIMEMITRRVRLEAEVEEEWTKVEAMTEKILPELLAYLAEHNPKAHEKLKAELEMIEADEITELDQ